LGCLLGCRPLGVLRNRKLRVEPHVVIEPDGNLMCAGVGLVGCHDLRRNEFDCSAWTVLSSEHAQLELCVEKLM
jgi:hypothetical protein